MEIHQQESGSEGTFFIGKKDQPSGELAYQRFGNTMIIEHTEVADELRGKGVGKQLLKSAVAFARKNKIKIVATCSFAKSVFDQTPEYHDVLEDNQ
jgi:predicted GNAT family acetyltransferase